MIYIIFIGIPIIYLIIIAILRCQRQKYLNNLTSNQEIFKEIFTMEFPFMWSKSMELAIINTFPHSSIYPRLSINNKFIDNPELRYDDSELIMREVFEHGVYSERGQKAIKRLNFIHSHFNIDNESYLYVLALFVYVPVKLINNFEWRKFTEKEINAIVKVISDVGKEMKIKNVPDSYQGYINIVNNCYNSGKIKVDDRKRSVYIFNSVLDMFLRAYPSCLHGIIKTALFTLMDKEITDGLMIEKPSDCNMSCIKSLLHFRAYVIKYFFPPRSGCCRDLRTSRVEGGKPRYGRFTKEKYCVGCPIKQVYHNGYNIKNLGKYKRVSERGVEVL